MKANLSRLHHWGKPPKEPIAAVVAKWQLHVPRGTHHTIAARQCCFLALSTTIAMSSAVDNGASSDLTLRKPAAPTEATAPPPSSQETTTVSKKEPPPEKASDSRRRTWVIASFWAIVVFLGLPIWWNSTSIYRANLPVEQMLEWSDGKVCWRPLHFTRLHDQSG